MGKFPFQLSGYLRESCSKFENIEFSTAGPFLNKKEFVCLF